MLLENIKSTEEKKTTLKHTHRWKKNKQTDLSLEPGFDYEGVWQLNREIVK